MQASRHIWSVGGLDAEMPMGFYRGVLMLATTVTDLFLIEDLGLLQISTQSDLADLRHAKEKLWIRFQCIISIPSAECLVVKGNMKK